MAGKESLEGNIGKVVYVLGSPPDCSDPADLYLSSTKTMMRNELESLIYTPYEPIMVVVGILTSAVSIPLELPPETDIYLIVKDADKDFNSYIIRLETLEELEELVCLLTDPEAVEKEDFNDDYVDYLSTIDVGQEIEDLYVLYGTEVDVSFYCSLTPTTLRFDERCRELFEKIEDQQK